MAETDPDTMQAIRVHEFGGPEKLSCERVPRPTPGPGEVLVRVEAAGVNPIDWLVREGYADEALNPTLPYVPGWDLSGTVESLGDGVTAFSPGDAVFGLVGMPDPGRTYATYAAVAADDVVAKPASLDHAEAAAVPMAALTAWHALFEAGDLRADQRVLVHAAAGGVGHMAVQFADHAGAHVVGTASGRNEAFLRELGVDEFVNYREQAFESVVDGVDLVLDAVGGETLERSLDAVADGGRIVTLPEPPGEAVVDRARSARNAAVEWFSVEPDSTTLAEVRTRIEAGQVAPTVSETFPLAEAAAAQKTSKAGHVRGKLVLRTDDGT
jgi:NADPH:quinone reductase-like Zn-dependent oxidoreductase